jgi:ABC-type multidrug transport system permease subunit
MMKRIWATFYARSLEFVRDRSTLGWNLILPVALVFGLAFVFSGEGQPLFKVGVVADKLSAEAKPAANLHPFLQTRHVDFYSVPADGMETAVRKVGRHQVDMLLDLRAGQMHYWVNSDSQKGYFLEKLLAGSDGAKLAKQSVQGKEIRYVDWVVPGILGMNMMFSCLFGVGFVIVRYRKSGYLKRLNATPLSATEFLLAQVFSRLLLVVVVTTLVFTGTNLFMHFTMEGSYLNLFLVLLLGAFTLISLSLLVAARVSSEELAGGLLNLLTWPMMVLSAVWFSMDGTNPFMQALSQLSPLTHMLAAARAIMLDGANLADISVHLLILAGMSVVFLAMGAATFKWTTE